MAAVSSGEDHASDGENGSDTWPEPKRKPGRHRTSGADSRSRCDDKEKILCGICQKLSKSRVSYHTHMYRVHHILVDDATEYTCQLCDKVFLSKQYMDCHIKTYHEDRSPMACPYCGKIKQGTHLLLDHIKTVHEAPRFVCDLCGQTCVTNSRLKGHIREKHERHRPFVCAVQGCSSAFFRQKSLSIHLRNVHEKAKDFRCGFDECEKAFHSRYSLKRHELVHTGAKPIKCGQCEYSCRQNTCLKLHLRRCHSDHQVLITQTDQMNQAQAATLAPDGELTSDCASDANSTRITFEMKINSRESSNPGVQPVITSPSKVSSLCDMSDSMINNVELDTFAGIRTELLDQFTEENGVCHSLNANGASNVTYNGHMATPEISLNSVPDMNTNLFPCSIDVLSINRPLDNSVVPQKHTHLSDFHASEPLNFPPIFNSTCSIPVCVSAGVNVDDAAKYSRNHSAVKIQDVGVIECPSDHCKEKSLASTANNSLLPCNIISLLDQGNHSENENHVQIGQQLHQDVNIDGQLHSNISGRQLDTEISHRQLEPEISCQQQDIEISDRRPDTEISDRRHDTEISDLQLDTEISRRQLGTEISCRQLGTEISHRQLDTEISDRRQLDTEIPDRQLSEEITVHGLAEDSLAQCITRCQENPAPYQFPSYALLSDSNMEKPNVLYNVNVSGTGHVVFSHVDKTIAAGGRSSDAPGCVCTGGQDETTCASDAEPISVEDNDSPYSHRDPDAECDGSADEDKIIVLPECSVSENTPAQELDCTVETDTPDFSVISCIKAEAELADMTALDESVLSRPFVEAPVTSTEDRTKGFLCPTCGEVLSTREYYNTHMSVSHVKPLPCVDRKSVCTKSRSRAGRPIQAKPQPKRHYEGPIVIQPITDANARFLCPSCGVSKATRSEYQRHLFAVHNELPSGTDKFTCTQCDKVFFSKFKFYQHEKIVHAERIPCKVCGKLLKPSYLGDHEKNVHGGYSGRFRCEICDLNCVSRSRLKFHNLEKHENVRRFSCPVRDCPTTFVRMTTYRIHMDLVHKKIKAYKCSWPDCGKEFGRQMHLARHVLLHSGEKPFKCQYCEYACRQKVCLTAHMAKNHSERDHTS